MASIRKMANIFYNWYEEHGEETPAEYQEFVDKMEELYPRMITLGLEFPGISLYKDGLWLHKITGVLINDDVLEIPEGIVAVRANAGYHNTDIKKIICPSTLRTIGEYAFSGASNLEEVELNSGITEIGRGAFTGTGLRKINIPGSIKKFSTNCLPNQLEEIKFNRGTEFIKFSDMRFINNLSTVWRPANSKFYLCFDTIENSFKKLNHFYTELEEYVPVKWKRRTGLEIEVLKDGWGDWQQEEINRICLKIKQFIKECDKLEKRSYMETKYWNEHLEKLSKKLENLEYQANKCLGYTVNNSELCACLEAARLKLKDVHQIKQP